MSELQANLGLFAFTKRHLPSPFFIIYILLLCCNIPVFLDYKISKGSGNAQFVQSDIAVIKVLDENLPMHKLRSACLPKSNQQVGSAIHAGWSEPPQIEYVQTQASGYVPFYR